MEQMNALNPQYGHAEADEWADAMTFMRAADGGINMQIARTVSSSDHHLGSSFLVSTGMAGSAASPAEGRSHSVSLLLEPSIMNEVRMCARARAFMRCWEGGRPFFRGHLGFHAPTCAPVPHMFCTVPLPAVLPHTQHAPPPPPNHHHHAHSAEPAARGGQQLECYQGALCCGAACLLTEERAGGDPTQGGREVRQGGRWMGGWVGGEGVGRERLTAGKGILGAMGAGDTQRMGGIWLHSVLWRSMAGCWSGELMRPGLHVRTAACVRRWESAGSVLWVGSILPTVQVDLWGRFHFALVRVADSSGRQKLVLRGRNGLTETRLMAALEQEVRGLGVCVEGRRRGGGGGGRWCLRACTRFSCFVTSLGA
jgi:hypothetical protein